MYTTYVQGFMLTFQSCYRIPSSGQVTCRLQYSHSRLTAELQVIQAVGVGSRPFWNTGGGGVECVRGYLILSTLLLAVFGIFLTPFGIQLTHNWNPCVADFKTSILIEIIYVSCLCLYCFYNFSLVILR